MYVQDTADNETKIEVATSFLSGVAEKWFIGTHLSSLFTTFTTFLNEFKVCSTQLDNKHQLSIKIKMITQDGYPPLEYSAEFQLILINIGKENYIKSWARCHFIHNLDKRLQLQVVPSFTPTDTIKDMAVKA